MSVIEIRDMSKVYGMADAATVALDEATINIERGEFVAIMGPSGSGKSTLLNMIGLLDTPTSGQYILDGQPVAGLSGNARARIRRQQIGFIFQSFNLLPRMTVIDNVALPLMYSGIGKTERLERASIILKKLDMGQREYYYPSQLSGGQAQRAAIARALSNNPSLVLADEPTGNLDSKNSDIIMGLLKELNEQGNTLVMVTHDPEIAAYAHRTVHMKDGRIAKTEHNRKHESHKSGDDDKPTKKVKVK